MLRELEAALFLFDNNEEKAKIFMQLLKDATKTTSKFDVRMDFSEESCRWCDKGECWFFMPDSRFYCEYHKVGCDFYEKQEN